MADVVRPVNTTILKELELASVVLKGFFTFQQKLSLHRIVELDFKEPAESSSKDK